MYISLALIVLTFSILNIAFRWLVLAVFGAVCVGSALAALVSTVDAGLANIVGLWVTLFGLLNAVNICSYLIERCADSPYAGVRLLALGRPGYIPPIPILHARSRGGRGRPRSQRGRRRPSAPATPTPAPALGPTPDGPLDVSLDHFGPTLVEGIRSGNLEPLLDWAGLVPRPELQRVLNTPDGDGNTPLHLAVLYQRYRLLPWLLNQGADPQVKNRQGLTPRRLAEALNDTSALKLIDAPSQRP